MSKSPTINQFASEDQLCINADYKSSLYRNKISVLHSKANKETENVKVQGKVEDDRRYVIEAVIIKVMKSRGKIDYHNLLKEAQNLLKVKFKPDPKQIKERTESLIERSFIERDENDKRILNYVA